MRTSAWRVFLAAGSAAVAGCLALPNATAEQAAEVLQRMRAASPQEQTFSAGLVRWDGQEISDELVARADRALYAAKAAGRDRIVDGGQQPDLSGAVP
jgi:starvation-inducible outer membrane lipoprotein